MDIKILCISLAFIIVGFLLYTVIPKKYKFIVLLLFSVIGVVVYSTYMATFLLLDIVFTYLTGLLINKVNKNFIEKKKGLEKAEIKILRKKNKTQRKWCLFFGIFFCLGFLIILKYFNFMSRTFVGFFGLFDITMKAPILKLVMPIGISYYTLQSIGYMIDVYRGKYQGDKNFLRLALFVSYFPQLFEGPFGRYDELAHQLYDGQEFNSKNVKSGLIEFVWGIFKIVFIANRAAIVAGEIFKNYSNYGNILIILGVFAFTVQLYAEFSGFINIAKGVSRVFGVELANNFEGPIFSQTVSEFWRRWHISLGAWFRDYIFYSITMSKPMLKLSKKMRKKGHTFFQSFVSTTLALLVVWFLTGIWHGADLKYIVYGLYYYALMVIGLIWEPIAIKFTQKTKINYDNIVLQILRIARTFVLVSLGMLIFRASNMVQFGNIFASIFKAGSLTSISKKIIDVYDIVLLSFGCLLLFVENIFNYKKINCFGVIAKKNMWVTYFTLLILIILIVVMGAYGAGYVPADPIYGAF